MGQVAQEIIERDRLRMRREFIRVMSFVCAVLSWYGLSTVFTINNTLPLKTLTLIHSQSMRRLHYLLLPLRLPLP